MHLTSDSVVKSFNVSSDMVISVQPLVEEHRSMPHNRVYSMPWTVIVVPFDAGHVSLVLVDVEVEVVVVVVGVAHVFVVEELINKVLYLSFPHIIDNSI